MSGTLGAVDHDYFLAGKFLRTRCSDAAGTGCESWFRAPLKYLSQEHALFAVICLAVHFDLRTYRQSLTFPTEQVRFIT
jgi:hypothetical protein